MVISINGYDYNGNGPGGASGGLRNGNRGDGVGGFNMKFCSGGDDKNGVASGGYRDSRCGGGDASLADYKLTKRACKTSGRRGREGWLAGEGLALCEPIMASHILSSNTLAILLPSSVPSS